MSRLADAIVQKQVPPHTLTMYWLAQAGFVFKTHSGSITYIDPYFSEIVEKRFGFKRLMLCPIRPEEVRANLVVCTHEHLDHMDIDALPVIASNGVVHFAGPIECYKQFRSFGIPEEQCHLLEEGVPVEIGDVVVHPVFADHGELAVDALGIVFDFSGIRVYHTGDTAYRPEEFQAAISLRPDIVLPCINGRYGNMNEQEAAILVAKSLAEVVIPTHYGMFIEHNGDLQTFIRHVVELAPACKVKVLEPGAEFQFIAAR